MEDLLRRFYMDWMNNPRWWFNSTNEDDTFLTNTYGDLLNISIDHIMIEPIAAIIVFDQLGRHVLRGQIASHVIQYYMLMALDICAIINYNVLDTRDWIFACLPIRHSCNVRRIHKIMNDIWGRLENSYGTDDFKLLKKFTKATYERCPMMYRLGVTYLPCLNDSPKIFTTCRNNPIYSAVEKQIELFENKRFILSLSGGVDSMILSYVLKCLQYRRKDFEFVAVMINYANRDCERVEEEFVVKWCREILQIPVCIRRIDEIKREPCRRFELRETYETYTRRVRMFAYKEAWMDFFGESQSNIPVMFGHNHDDCFENILTNITQQKKYDNLKGMSDKMECESTGICFLRPMLGISKKDIYKFAQTYEIPHLPNSTVSWCQRGQIRDNVRPTLEKWDTNSIRGFFQLSQVVSELHDVLQILVDKYVSKTIEGKCSLDSGESKWPTSKMFWRQFIAHVSGGIFISQKSLSAFIERLEKMAIYNVPSMVIPLHKRVAIKFTKYGKEATFIL